MDNSKSNKKTNTNSVKKTGKRRSATKVQSSNDNGRPDQQIEPKESNGTIITDEYDTDDIVIT